MPKKKTPANAQYPRDLLPPPTGVAAQHVSIIQPERIDQLLNPDFISRLAAKLWDGDDRESIKRAISLIKGCAEGLATRKSVLLYIQLSPPPQSKPSRRNSRFWRRVSLESVVEIAASLGRSSQPEDAIERAFLIIENARIMLEKGSEIPDEKSKNDLVTSTQAGPSAENFASAAAQLFKPHWTWKEAVNRITGTKRSYRAESAFLRFLTEPSVCDATSLSDKELKRAIAGWKKEGFALNEVRVLEQRFKHWHDGWVKSRQRDSGKKIGTKNLRRKSL